jgi:predicted RNA binding protein YcfA (HicA-like mRNA interferase family)
MDSKTVIKALLKDGWTEVGQKGSHKQFRHPVKPGRVTVPHPEGSENRDVEKHRQARRIEILGADDGREPELCGVAAF